MSNHEIFLLPGQLLSKLLLSVFDVDPNTVTDESLDVLGFILAVLFWLQFCSAVIALIKKRFGFHDGGSRR
ncbi:hypothetical protein [Marinomonas mediterranea]|uniref:hypothetical protein n=1 Tax=Marinomonas mediterranea TaxID=119864 RepID=UPI00234A0421|nr:hypothetical protein [Marinomonas mediterranea]WCN09988.1 hypothetical protein GV055_14190 [Marinomonas mediterranea]